MAEDYEKDRHIGSGTVATVWAARDLRLGRLVAIKEVKAPYSQSPDFVRAYFEEAGRVAAVNHPKVLAIYEANPGLDPPRLVLEHADGGSLREALERGPLGPEEIIRVLRDCLEGLAELHRRGIVHGNLKPENVLRVAGVYKVGDFTVRTRPSGETRVYSEPRYLPPESLRRESLGPDSDLYSLGLIAYELAVGSLLFKEIVLRSLGRKDGSGDPWHQFHQVPGDLPPPTINGQAMPEPLGRIILRLAKKSRGERCRSAAEALQEVETLTGMGGGGRAVTQELRLPADRGKRSRLHRVLLIAGASVALLTVAVLVLAGGSRPIELSTLPPGVEVVLADGRVLGVTPRTMKLSGSATVVLRKPGFKDYELVLDEKTSPKLEIRLEALARRVDSNVPGADVWSGNERLGTAPLDVAIGREVSIRHEGFETLMTTVPAGEGDWKAELRPLAAAERTAAVLDKLLGRAEAPVVSLREGRSGQAVRNDERVRVGTDISLEVGGVAGSALAVVFAGGDGTLALIGEDGWDGSLDPSGRFTPRLGRPLQVKAPAGVDRIYAVQRAAPFGLPPSPGDRSLVMGLEVFPEHTASAIVDWLAERCEDPATCQVGVVRYRVVEE